MSLFLIVGLSAAASTIIQLEGTEGYNNSITMDIPINVTGSSAEFDTNHVYKAIIKSENTTIFVYLKSFGAAKPSDPLNVTAETNIQYFRSQNMRLLADSVGQNKNYGVYRHQEFGWADGSYMSMLTFMLDKKHVVFVADALDRATITKMFDSINPGVAQGMFYS